VKLRLLCPDKIQVIDIYSLTYIELIEKNENTNQWSATPGNAEAI
jgi:hypothetical protein